MNRLGVAANVVEQYLAGALSHEAALVFYGGKCWRYVLHIVHIAEADERNIVGNGQSLHLNRFHCGKKQSVVERYYTVRAFLQVEQGVGSVYCRRRIHITIGHIFWPYEQSVVVQRIYVAVFAVGHHLHVTRAAQDCDAPTTLFYQVARGFVGGFHAVSRHRRVVFG